MAVLLVLASLIVTISAQTCRQEAIIGPCINDACPVAGAQCILANEICCAAGGVIQPPPAVCVDLVDPVTRCNTCPQNRNLCNNPAWIEVMTKQCPRTCGRCPPAGK